MQDAGLNEAESAIKISGRNINNLRYADDFTLMEESEELKSLLIRMKKEKRRELKNWLKSKRSRH